MAEVDQTSGGNAILQTPFLYTGGLHDRTTGWIKNGARYYNPTEGRWTQHDTLDTPLDPLNANRYAYAGCNPINHTDLTGLQVDALDCGLALAADATAVVGLGLALSSTGAGATVGVPVALVGVMISGVAVVRSCYPGYW